VNDKDARTPIKTLFCCVISADQQQLTSKESGGVPKSCYERAKNQKENLKFLSAKAR